MMGLIVWLDVFFIFLFSILCSWFCIDWLICLVRNSVLSVVVLVVWYRGDCMIFCYCIFPCYHCLCLIFFTRVVYL